MKKVYALYDLNNGFFGTTTDEDALDMIGLAGGSHELIDMTHIKCDVCRTPTKRISDTACECVSCNKIFSLDIYQGRETKTNEYAIYHNGHYRMFLYLSDDNMWILTNGGTMDIDTDFNEICTRNGIRIQSDTRG
jgi:hypothetical protein